MVKATNRERNPGRGPPAKKRKVAKGETSELDNEDHQEPEKSQRRGKKQKMLALKNKETENI